MKQILIVFLVAVSLSSCLKQSIADAMLASMNTQHSNDSAIISYSINGNPVRISSVTREENSYNFANWTKSTDSLGSIYYTLNAYQSTNEIHLSIYADSLILKNYSYGTQSEFTPVTLYYTDTATGDIQSGLYRAGDTLSINITSYNKGYITGNFTGRLTPLMLFTYIVGTPGSTLITNGSFQNIPVNY